MLQIMVRLSVILFLAATLFSGAPSYAQSLSEVLEEIRRDSSSMSVQVHDCRMEPDEIRKTLVGAREELAEVEVRIEVLLAESERLKILRREIYQKLDEKAAVLVRGTQRPEDD